MVTVVLLWTAVGLGLSAAAYAIVKRAYAPGPALPAPAREPDLATLMRAVRRMATALSAAPGTGVSVRQAQAELADAWRGLPDALRERLMARGVPESRIAELYEAPRPTDGTQRRRLQDLAEALAADLDLT